MRLPELGTDGKPLRARARQKLENRGWRWRRAWWIFPSILTVGVLGCVGFLWAGIKTGRVKYYVSGGIWLLVSISVVAVPSGPQTAVLASIAMFGPAIQATLMHPVYLLERAEDEV